MAITPALQLVTASTDHTQITIKETTADYGSPAANTVCHYVMGFKKNFSTDDQDITSLADNSVADNGAADNTWTFGISLTGDGWYDFWLFICPLWQSGPSYTLNQAVYDQTNDKIYKSIVASTTAGLAPSANLTQWELLFSGKTVNQIEYILDNYNTYGADIYVVKLSDIMVENSEIEFAKIVANACIECDGCSDLSDERKEIDNWEFFLRCAYINESKQNYEAAERAVEALKDLAEGNCVNC